MIKDYFLYTPPLSSFEGATLTPNVISLLAVNTNAPTMVAFADPQAIGKITIAEQPVSVQRANQNIELQEGDFIYLNDVIGKVATNTIKNNTKTLIAIIIGSKRLL